MTKIAIGTTYFIDDEDVIDDFHQPPALAYGVYMKGSKDRIGVGLVCDPKAPPRLSIVGTLQNLTNRAMPLVLDHRIVNWPAENRACPVIIFDIAEVNRVFPRDVARIRPYTEDKLTNNFILPASQMLQELHSNNITHMAIRADSLTFPDKQSNEIWLGECISSPAGMVLPFVYQTIKNCLALPSARQTHPTNDIYAFGVTILALMVGEIPLRNLSEADVLQQKLAQGSFGALCTPYANAQRLPASSLEPLRAMLHDNTEQRWTITEVMEWSEGRRQTPKQNLPPIKATHALRFAGKEYYTVRELAFSFHQFWEQAIPMIRTNAVNMWLRRHLADNDTLERFLEAASGAVVQENSDAERALGRIIIAFDPFGPIRYRDLSITLSGIPLFLAFHGRDPKIRDLFSTMLRLGLIHFYLNIPENQANNPRELSRVERYRNLLARTGFGQGVERIIYEYCPDFPCQSPLLDREYVIDIKDLLPALDRVALSHNHDLPYLIDQDIAAFLVAKLQTGSIEREVAGLDSGIDSEIGRLFQGYILSALQKNKHSQEVFPDLAKAFIKLMDPVIDRFHSLETKQAIKDRLQKVVRHGYLPEIMVIIDNRKELEIDKTNFDKVKQEYASIITNLIDTHNDILNKSRIAAFMGGQISSIVSSLAAGAVILAASLIKFFYE